MRRFLVLTAAVTLGIVLAVVLVGGVLLWKDHRAEAAKAERARVFAEHVQAAKDRCHAMDRLPSYEAWQDGDGTWFISCTGMLGGMLSHGAIPVGASP